MTKFDWTRREYDAQGRMSNYRKVVAYAAVSATERIDETYEEFRATSSGHVTPWSHTRVVKRQVEMAIELWNGAVRSGFVDC